MTDLRARARKAADLIIDGLLDRAQFPVIPTSEREHSAGIVAEALAEQIEADARMVAAMADDWVGENGAAACVAAATAIRGQEKKR